jgi:hypothetical protein
MTPLLKMRAEYPIIPYHTERLVSSPKFTAIRAHVADWLILPIVTP